eukprot:Skav226300  [mRNA]  locus=scaffold3301:338543:348832:- [translate_table: standard]
MTDVTTEISREETPLSGFASALVGNNGSSSVLFPGSGLDRYQQTPAVTSARPSIIWALKTAPVSKDANSTTKTCFKATSSACVSTKKQLRRKMEHAW